MPTGAERVVLAAIRRPWGRAGELLLELHTDWPEERFAAGTRLDLRWPSGRRETVAVRAFRTVGTGPLLTLEGVDSIDGAKPFAGATIEAPAAALERLPGGDLLHADLIGLTVVDREGSVLGAVSGIEEGAAADLLIVRLAGGAEVLVPLAEAICVAIDLERGLVTLDPPAGLLDPDAATDGRGPAAGERP